jgi:rhodanese-related sulfurtransferase
LFIVSIVQVDVRDETEAAGAPYPAPLNGGRVIPLTFLTATLGDVGGNVHAAHGSESVLGLHKDALRPVVCLCRSGNRSGKAAEALRAAGFTNAVSFVGGLNGLLAAAAAAAQ